MSISNESPISEIDLVRRARQYWLPPAGFGNGLDSLFWATVADVPSHNAPLLLAALREAGIPGWAAPITHHLPHARRVDSNSRPYRIWVSTGRLSAAEDVLMRSLNDDPALDRVAEHLPRTALQSPTTHRSIR